MIYGFIKFFRIFMDLICWSLAMLPSASRLFVCFQCFGLFVVG